MTALTPGLPFVSRMLGPADLTNGDPLRILTVPFVEANEVDLSELIVRLAGASGLEIGHRPGGNVGPVTGLAGKLQVGSDRG